MSEKIYEGINNNDGSISVDKEILNTGGYIHYKNGNMDVHQQYHPFWLIPKTNKITESHRMTILDFSK